MSSSGKIAVLYGGESAEREVSLNSGNAVLRSLQKQGFNVVGFDPSEKAISELVKHGVDRAVIMLHGRGGEDGTIQGALQFLGIPYTGSGVLGSALAMDKIRSKRLFQSLKLPTAEFETVSVDQLEQINTTEILEELGGVAMVKPALEGSSIGMAKVSDAEELQAALKEAFEYDNEVLIERYIVGREFTVSILDDEVLPSIRMETPRTFYDYKAKYQVDSTLYHCPSGLEQETEAELADIASKAFNAVGASGWGRVDVMQDQDGRFYLLEVNTVPGMTEKSLVPMAAKQAGMTFEQLTAKILQSSYR